MPVNQEFHINTRDDMVGNLYGMSYTNSVRHTYTNKKTTGESTEIPFGTVVQQGAQDRWCQLGDGTTPGATVEAKVLGLAIRTINREAKFRPSTGEVAYADNTEIAVLKDGFMTVDVDGTAAVGGKVYVDVTAGTIHAVAGANRICAVNMQFSSSAPRAARPTTNAVVEISSSLIFDYTTP